MKAALAALLVLLATAKPAIADEDAATLYRKGQTILAEATQESHRRDGAALITRSAVLGHLPAQYHLGFLFGEGRGVTRDAQKALHWFRRAADKGDAKAQYAVGLALSRQSDKREAAQWFRRAADQGMVDAQFQLALLYEKGYGVTVNEARARRLYQSAAKTDTAAIFNLALMLDEGRGGPPDLNGAIDLYIRAAQASLPAAQHALCELLLDGHGVARNLEDAVGWCRAAAQQDHAPAQLLLATFYALGHGVEPDEGRAAAWLIVAAKLGFPPAIKARDGLLPSLPPDIRARAKGIAKTLRPNLSFQ